MKVLVKTKDLSRDEWLRYRTKGIGGSDVSIIAGINPYKSVYQLWLEKTGRIIPEQTDSEFAHFGTLQTRCRSLLTLEHCLNRLCVRSSWREQA